MMFTLEKESPDIQPKRSFGTLRRIISSDSIVQTMQTLENSRDGFVKKV